MMMLITIYIKFKNISRKIRMLSGVYITVYLPTKVDIDKERLIPVLFCLDWKVK